MDSVLGNIKEGLNGMVAVTVIISFGSFTAIDFFISVMVNEKVKN